MGASFSEEDLKAVDSVIYGRIEPYIYAFRTGKVPEYLKVGDTYRPVSMRLNEWKKHFPDLVELYREKATIGDSVFFRDYSVHVYLEETLGKKRLQQKDIDVETYYSREFFKDTTPTDVQRAIGDIKEKYTTNSPAGYQYYDASSKQSKEFKYSPTGMLKLRPNQEKTVSCFIEAVNRGRTNLLMYAVMRFGKSFTAMCCAKAKDYKIVVVVSAKTDVLDEWKQTVEKAKNFCDDYEFLTAYNLSKNQNTIQEILDKGKGVVVFLSLADLQGDKIKEKHVEILSKKIDLLIIDETHYGARADSYGKILRQSELERDANDEKYDNDYIEYNDSVEQEIKKVLNAKVRLHLSGTPYRILMGGEFEQEDIIAFYQFSDIVEEKNDWDANHLLSEVEEWDNPYYGFPQMVRFAFNPSASAMARLEELKKAGATYAFSSLFKTKSIKKDKEGKFKTFIFEREILDLFLVIDGAKEDEQLFGFLNYDKIKNGKMCRHIVCVLPYCASCDALQKLLEDNKGLFVNLNDYHIINISGIDKPQLYKNTTSIKNKISYYEENGEKTITLTVNRMLTGSTVKEWDTMLFFKDTASPQEYDQAIFRLQNQYIRFACSEKEGDKAIRINMKPQTLLVDFDPQRMFYMQEQKSLIYNANTEKNGNKQLAERIAKELSISPIIASNGHKMVQVTANELIKEVTNYSNSRGVLDEVVDIPVDMALLKIDSVRKVIDQQAKIGSKEGLKASAHSGEEKDLDINGTNIEGATNAPSENVEGNGNETTGNKNETEEEVLIKKFKMYYSRILFYSYLTDDEVNSLEEIIESIDKTDNQRISKNLSLDKDILCIIFKTINPNILHQLDNKIHHISALSVDESLNPVERAIRAIDKFGKLSESEVPTPLNIAVQMVNEIPDITIHNLTTKGGRLLDIASKIGEFAIAVCRRAASLGIDVKDIKDSILSIPTSPIAYEFTRKIYTVLNLSVDGIVTKFTTYDLLKIGGEKDIDYSLLSRILHQNVKYCDLDLNVDIKEGSTVKFEAIVGNPPYHEPVSHSEKNSALGKPLFPYFTIMCMKLDADYTSLIIPSKWFTGNAQDKSFIKFREFMKKNHHIKKYVNYMDESDVFKKVEIKGGVGYFLNEKGYNGKVEFTNVLHEKTETQKRDLFIGDLDFIINRGKDYPILQKVISKDFISLMTITTGRSAFGIIGKDDVIKRISVSKKKAGLSELRCKNKEIRYINPSIINKNKNIFENYKVFISKAAGSPKNDKNIISCPYVGGKNTACTDSFLVIGNFDSVEEAENLAKYLKTKFLRFLVSILKSTHNVTQIVYRFVPMQKFSNDSDVNWRMSIKEIDNYLYEKYGFTEEEISYIESIISSVEE